MDFNIDRESAISVRNQIKGTIEYGISFGVYVVGAQLPSVRELAEQIGVAPMTISGVYQDLKKEGLIETRNGSGTFVADSSQARMAFGRDIERLHNDIDALIDRAQSIGVRAADLTSMISARMAHRRDIGRRATVAMIGLFAQATESYAQVIATQLGDTVHVEGVTISAIRADSALLERISGADLVLCFATMHADVSGLLPNSKVVSIRFIPSEQTRLALASLDPMSAVVAVSRFSTFLPILKSGVQRFAAHVQNITAYNIDDGTLQEALGSCNVIVFSTGAEAILQSALPGIQTIEYRHVPDPGDIWRLVAPFLANSRSRDRKEAS